MRPDLWHVAPNSLNAFRLINAGGAVVPVRWSMVPVDPFEPISTTARGKADKNYLFDAASLAYVNSFQLLKVISPTCMPFVSCSKTCHQKRRYGHALATVADGYRGLRFRRRIFKRSYLFPARDFKTSASLGTKFRTSKVSFGSNTTNRIFNVLMTSFLRARRIVGTRAERGETNRLAK
jgi:hypothetical protein